MIPGRPERTLCFDIENKPGTYGPGDYTHPKVTAIAARFLDEQRGQAWILNRTRPGQMRDAAREFADMWCESTVVMGHNIRRHDIRILNGMMDMLELPRLPGRRMVDTFRDMPRAIGYSRSLENLCARWGCPIDKLHMPEHLWEQAYDGRPEALERMRLRAQTDVEMNIWLFGELRRRCLL